MSVAGRLFVNRTAQVQFANNRCRSDREESFNPIHQLLVRYKARAESLHMDRNRFRYTYRISQLNLQSTGGTGCHQVFSDVTGRIRSGAIYLRGVLAGKGASPVCRHTTIGIHNDFSPRKARISLRPADNKASGRINIDFCFITQKCFGNNRVNHFSYDISM